MVKEIRGDAKRPLGDATRLLGDAKIILGDAKIIAGDAKRFVRQLAHLVTSSPRKFHTATVRCLNVRNSWFS